ncbi:uncharacterized protein G2W53_000417 [Senna tora]|uniref:Uncharacterized protein n=1 Tax=Senna tora TaxID=362788 RepID=A0A835CLK8_9FABA|nr:uncharacterized protein G2W53_000417 [Senna tora]
MVAGMEVLMFVTQEAQFQNG